MKRACPYDANLLRMTKIHLMDYDVDKLALQKIHDDTLIKLRNGARQVLTDLDMQQAIKNHTEEVQVEKAMKQREVTNYFSSTSKLSQPAKATTVKPEDEKKNCNYCDGLKEAAQCGKCEQFYCQRCCFALYTDVGETFVCMSCA